MYILLNTLWFIWELKFVLFWLYLWQLKEYHLGRFIDHFRTHKGKQLLFGFGQIFKLILILFFLANSGIFSYLFSFLFLVYFAEMVLLIRAIFKKTLKRPVKTIKTVFLSAVSFLIVILFLIWVNKFPDNIQPQWLLIFDILTPVVVSFVVLLLQPFFVAGRNRILKKATEKRKKIENLTVISITGSYGKTSTKEFLKVILSKKFKVLSTKEHQNSEIGIAKCILEDLNPEHQIFIVEVGAYNKGKVKEVCSMLAPKIGIVTGVNEQHLALFGSLNNLLSAEGGGEMAESLPENGILVVNGDNKYCLDLYKKTVKNKKIYSTNNNVVNSDVWAENITVNKDSVSFMALNKNGEMTHLGVKVLGKQNVQNLLAAILVARELGITFGEISEACDKITQEQAGMILRKGKHGIDIVDSSYSSNPDGVMADLDYLSVFQQKKVIIIPCLIELGKKSSEIHEKIGQKIAEICDLAVITSKDKFIEIKKGAVQAGMKEKNILLCDKSEDIYSAITLFCKSGDAVLLEGRVPPGLVNLLVK